MGFIYSFQVSPLGVRLVWQLKGHFSFTLFKNMTVLFYLNRWSWTALLFRVSFTCYVALKSPLRKKPVGPSPILLLVTGHRYRCVSVTFIIDIGYDMCVLDEVFPFSLSLDGDRCRFASSSYHYPSSGWVQDEEGGGVGHHQCHVRGLCWADQVGYCLKWNHVMQA